MFSSTWRNCLRQLAQAIQGGRRRRSRSPARHFWCLELEWHEARVVPTVATTTLAVNPYTDVSLVPPFLPDGSVVPPALDSRILKVTEQNNLLVATHSVSVGPTEDDAQWYIIDDSSGVPKLKDQGDVSAGNNTYPAIDINPAGDIGMTFMQSGRDTATDFLSMYITGRTPSDLAGRMEAPVLAQAGRGVDPRRLGTVCCRSPWRVVPGRGRPAVGRALASGLRRLGSAGNHSRNLRRQGNSHKPNRFRPDTFLPVHRGVQETPRFLGRSAERLFRRCTTY